MLVNLESITQLSLRRQPTCVPSQSLNRWRFADICCFSFPIYFYLSRGFFFSVFNPCLFFVLFVDKMSFIFHFVFSQNLLFFASCFFPQIFIHFSFRRENLSEFISLFILYFLLSTFSFILTLFSRSKCHSFFSLYFFSFKFFPVRFAFTFCLVFSFRQHLIYILSSFFILYVFVKNFIYILNER